VIGKPVIFLFVQEKTLSLVSLLHAPDGTILSGIFRIDPVDRKELLTMPDILQIIRSEIALAKGKVVNGIEQVRLSDAVITDKTVYIVRKGKVGLAIVLEIVQREPLKMHLRRIFV
jgi:hypothetical protein